MATNTGLELTVGQLQGDVNGLKERVVEVQNTLKGQDDKLDKLLAYHNQRKGARAIGKAVFSLVASGGFIGWIYEHFTK